MRRKDYVKKQNRYYYKFVSRYKNKNYMVYWKRRLKVEESELYTKCVQLKMKSQKDGKNYLTDTLDTEGIFK